MISPHSIIHPRAKIADSVEIGPWVHIGPDVEIGEGTWVGPSVVIKGPTRIGKNNKIFQFSSIGGDPQDKKYKGESTLLEIGNNNVFRESFTAHRGTVLANGVTRIGNDNFFMAFSHVAHDCIVGNQVVFSNHASIAGHVVVQDYAVLSGFCGVHQFCTIGAYSFLGGGTMVAKDVLPYVIVNGNESKVWGLNLEGLRRHAFSPELITNLRRAYKIIYRSNLTSAQAIEQLQKLSLHCPEINRMIDMLQKSKRGVVR